MTPNDREALGRLINDTAVQAAIEEMMDGLTKQAVGKTDAETRQQALHMLWGLEALVVKMRTSAPKGANRG